MTWHSQKNEKIQQTWDLWQQRELFQISWELLVKVLCGQLAVFELRSARLVLQLPCHEKAVRGLDDIFL